MLPIGEVKDTDNPVAPAAARVARVGIGGFPVETSEESRDRAQAQLALLQKEAEADPTLANDESHQREIARAAALAGATPTPAPAASPASAPAPAPAPAAKSAPTWDEVKAMPEMKKLSSSELEQARNQYFDDVVLPKVPLGMADHARAAFDADTKPSALSRVVGVVKDAVDELHKDTASLIARRGVSLSGESLDQLERSYRSLKQGVFAVDLGATRRALNTIDRVDGGERLMPADDPMNIRTMSPERRAQTRAKLQEGYADDLRTIAKEAVEISGLYQNPNAVEAIRAANNAQWRNAWNAFTADPVGIVKDLSLSNAAQIAPMAGLGIAGAAVKGVPGLMLGFAGGSFPVDYAMSLVEYLGDQGIDLKDYKAVDTALRRPGFLDKLQNYAATHAAGVTIGDTVAGKAMKPVTGTLRQAATAAAGNVAKGIAGESGGEALGEYMATGKIQPGDVIAEGLAAGPMTVAGSTASTIAAQKGTATAVPPAPAAPIPAGEVLGTPEAAPAAPNAAAPQATGTVPPPPRGSSPQAVAAAAAQPTEASNAAATRQKQGIDQLEHQGAHGERPAAGPSGGDSSQEGGQKQETPRGAVPGGDASPQGDQVAFTPTKDWQAVPAEAVLPPGLEIRMNMQTGHSEARLAPGTVDEAAHQAATSPTNELPTPSEAQKDAGNYQKGHTKIGGLDVSIENPAGSRRRPAWPMLKDHYGYVRGTIGYDKDHVDVFVKPGTPEEWNGTAYVVNQNKADGKFDEHKVMLGFDSEDAARKAYLSNYSKGWKGLGSIAAMSMDEFKSWATDKTDAGPKGGPVAPIEGEQKELSPAEQKRRTELRRKAAERKQIDPQRDSLVSAVIKLGGLNTEHRLDITGDDKGNKGIPGVGYLFSARGGGPDDLATRLGQFGYITKAELEDVDGGVQALKDKIADELSGRRSHYSASSEAAYQAEAKRQAEMEEDRAKAIGEAVDHDVDLTIAPEELQAEGLPSDAETVAHAELGARAEAIEEGILERLAMQHDSDDAYWAAVVKFLKDHEDAANQRPDEKGHRLREEEGEGAGVRQSHGAPAQAGEAAESGAAEVAPPADRLKELVGRYKPDNPFAEKAARARAKYEHLVRPTARDKAMEQAFPLGAGYGRKGGEKRIESTVNRAVEAEQARKDAEYDEARAAAFDRGEVNAQGRSITKESQERSEKRQASEKDRAQRMQEATAARAGKQKWQVPASVWADSTGNFGGGARKLIIGEHNEAVIKAIEEGKDVPLEVLAELPPTVDIPQLEGFKPGDQVLDGEKEGRVDKLVVTEEDPPRARAQVAFGDYDQFVDLKDLRKVAAEGADAEDAERVALEKLSDREWTRAHGVPRAVLNALQKKGMVESQPYTTTELGGQGIEWRKITPESKARKEKFEQDLAARKEKRIALAKRLQEDLENDGGVKATTDNGSILLTKNISSNAPYRVTSFLKDGTPSGHREYGSIDGLGINGAVHEFMGSDVKLEERPSLELTGQTEAELKSEDLKRAKELEEKRARENAPPPEEFTLTGSSRPADEAAARGQNELFDQGGLFRKQPEKSAFEQLRDRMTLFASGLSRGKEIIAAGFTLSRMKSGGIGVEAGELSDNALEELAHAVADRHAQVFVDSGAFSVFRLNMRNADQAKQLVLDVFGDNATPAKVELDFDKVLAKYDQLTANIGELNEAEEDLPKPLLVMPDVVGDQAATLALLDRYGKWIATEATFDLSRPIVPLQKGEKSLADMHKTVVEKLGTDRFIVGIPSNEKAVSAAELLDFLKDAKPRRLHFLGAASEKTLEPKLQSVLDSGIADQLEHLSADANLLRSKLNQIEPGTPRHEAVKQAVEPVVAKELEQQKQIAAAADALANAATALKAVSEGKPAPAAKPLGDVPQSLRSEIVEEHKTYTGQRLTLQHNAEKDQWGVITFTNEGTTVGQWFKAEDEQKARDRYAKLVEQDKEAAEVHRENVRKETSDLSRPMSIAQHDKIMQRAREGDITPDELKAALERTAKSEDAIKAELRKYSKEQLGERMGRRPYSSDKKESVVDQAYVDMLSDYTLGESYTYSPFSAGGGPLTGIRGTVEKTTTDTIVRYAERVKAARAERAERLAKIKKTMENPQTLEEFETFARYHKQGEAGLTAEQRARYDELRAAAGREKRAKEQEQRATVQAAGEKVGAKIIETKHTRDGYDLFVVQLEKRVERDDYNKLIAAAKKLGGWYSSFKGNGAVPGFQFKTKEAAEAFQKLTSEGDTEAVKEVALERRQGNREAKKNAAAERLAEMADRMEESAQQRLSADRLTNTARRARMAASAEAQAAADERMAKTLRAISNAIEGGTATNLAGIRTRAQVEELDSILTRAKYDAIRAEGKNFEEEKDRAPVESDVNHAEYPRYTGYRSNFAELARSVIVRVPGAKMAGERLLKGTDDSKDYARDVSNDMGVLSKVVLSKHAAESEERQAAIFQTKSEAEAAVRRSGMRRQAMIVPLTGKISKGGYAVVMSPAEAKGRGIWQPKEDTRLQIAPELMEELLDKVAAFNAGKAYSSQITVGYYFDSVRESRKRLHGMGLETAPELRAALREYVGLRAAGRARDRVKELERALAGNPSVGIDFFPTPAPLAQRMADALELQPGMTVLEPSAGKGNLADAVRAAEPGAQIDAIEMSSTLREILKEKGYPLVGSDFMEFKPDELYDRIIMNPPFSKGMDADHVRHAYDMLKPGGRLVAITGEGIFFREDQKSKGFREWFDNIGGTSENMEGAFLDRREVKTTGVASRLLTIDKPADGRGDGPAFHRAYHGSPHDFERFTLQKIDTGEGAQSYGWGLYFAEKRAVADWYRSKLSGRPFFFFDGKALEWAALGGFDQDEQVAADELINHWRDPAPTLDHVRAEIAGFAQDVRGADVAFWNQVLRGFDKLVKKGLTLEGNRGRLYQVNLAPKEDEYLRWDKPLSEQSAKVRAALKKIKFSTYADDAWTGGHFYSELAKELGGPLGSKHPAWMRSMGITAPSEQAASKALLAAGIPGIKYLDQVSRNNDPTWSVYRSDGTPYMTGIRSREAAEEVLVEAGRGSRISEDAGTHNYVVFDDKLVDIEAKFRRGDGGPGDALRQLDAHAVVQQLTKDWKNAPRVEVVNRAADLPFAAPQDALGAFWRGKTYIVAGNHATNAELQFTVFHETLGHAGLRGFFGKDLDPALEQLWVSNANIRRAAADWMAKNAKPADWTARDYRLQAVEEALSNLAGSGREISGLGKLMAAIQAWLRAHGFSAVADFLESLTDAEALHVLSQARQHIVAGDAPQVLTAGMAANFSRQSSVFYSELSRRIAVHSMPTAPTAQWASIIKNMQGVKPDEVEWSGVLDWLGMQEGKVSREALVDYLAANGVKVEETVLGDDEKSAAITDAEREENLGRLQREYMEWGERNGFGRDLSSADEMLGRSDITLTDEQRSYLRNFGRRWDTAQYGTSELEQLRVSLDARGFDIEDDEIAGIFALKRRADGKLFSDSQGAEHEDNFGGQLSDLPDDVTRDAYRYMELREHQEGYKVVPGATQYEKYTLPGGKNYRELLLSWPDQKIQAAADRKEDVTGRYFKNVHFQEVDNYNVLAHVRFNERTDSEGKRVLFVEEVQSDWAQTGRRQGFQTLGGLDDQQQALLKAYHARVKESGMRSLSPREKAQYKQLDETQRAYEKEKVLKVAPGPFVQKTDQWAALVLKRMIAWAVQNGFDRVAWTNGDQQADRYDLSKHISHINWGKLDDGSYNFQAYGKSYDDGANPVLTQSGVKASGLADFIGKDAADKILSSSGTRGSLSNLDLKIGGEGMRDFYDNVLPTIANNVLKKLGGGRVATVMIHRQIQIAQESPANGGGWYVAEAGSGGVVLENDLKTKAEAEKWADEHAKVLRQPGFDITAKMKETLRDGVPLFSRAIERAERMEAPAFSRKDDDVVPTPSGAKNFGEITPELAKEIKREPGEIHLTRAGLAHIEERRGDRIRGDWPSIEAFVEYVGRNFNMVLQPKSTAQLVLVRANGTPAGKPLQRRGAHPDAAPRHRQADVRGLRQSHHQARRMLTPETVKAGMGHDYGIPEAVSDRRDLMYAHQRSSSAKCSGVLGKLMNLTRAESRVAYAWMNDRDGDELLEQLPEDSRQVLRDLKARIDELSARRCASASSRPTPTSATRWRICTAATGSTSSMRRSRTARARPRRADPRRSVQGPRHDDAAPMAKIKAPRRNGGGASCARARATPAHRPDVHPPRAPAEPRRGRQTLPGVDESKQPGRSCARSPTGRHRSRCRAATPAGRATPANGRSRAPRATRSSCGATSRRKSAPAWARSTRSASPSRRPCSR
jgi:phospholipid N-methyltransferase